MTDLQILVISVGCIAFFAMLFVLCDRVSR